LKLFTVTFLHNYFSYPLQFSFKRIYSILTKLFYIIFVRFGYFVAELNILRTL